MHIATTLQKFSMSSCCLCGSSEKLTREHKIKASALRKEFGEEALVVGNSAEQKMKSAQSTNSKHLKFSVSICELCNTARTQQADREFDSFHGIALERIRRGESPMSAIESARYEEGSESYLNLFRYFAKLLSCHIAAVGAPIPVALARFAIGLSAVNRIWLQVKSDPVYQYATSHIGEYQYAAHGGLIVYGDKDTCEPNAFHSSITIGPVQYVFHTRLEIAEKMEIHLCFPDFFAWCISRVDDAKNNPIPDNVLWRLGLKDEADQ